MSTTDDTGATITPIGDAPSAPKDDAELEVMAAAQAALHELTGKPVTRANWAGHGEPKRGFAFLGRKAEPSTLAAGINVSRIVREENKITLWGVIAGDGTDAEVTVTAGAMLWIMAGKITKAMLAKEAKISAPPKPAKAPKVKAAKTPKPDLPEGYEVRYPHRTYLLMPTEAWAEAHPDDPKILVMCRRHGTLNRKATSVTDADRLGSVPVRPEWCPKCKADAAAKAAQSE